MVNKEVVVVPSPKRIHRIAAAKYIGGTRTERDIAKNDVFRIADIGIPARNCNSVAWGGLPGDGQVFDIVELQGALQFNRSGNMKNNRTPLFRRRYNPIPKRSFNRFVIDSVIFEGGYDIYIAPRPPLV